MAVKCNNGPAGVWDESTIVGSMCTIRYMPLGYGFCDSDEESGFDCDEEHKIIGIYHRVLIDGSIHPVYLLEKIPNRLFKPEEILITKLCISGSSRNVCGEFLSGD